MEMIAKMWGYIASDPNMYFTCIWQHIYLDVISFFLIGLFSFPIGYMCAKSKKVSAVTIIIVNLVMVIPTLSVLGFIRPYTGFGAVTAIIGLVVSGMPFMIINTMTAFKNVNPMILENARAMGMENWRVCFGVEVPLALPTILNGVRITCVSLIAGTTLATYVSAGGLGFYIVHGLGMNRLEMTYVGAFTVAIFAVSVDKFFASIQKNLHEKY